MREVVKKCISETDFKKLLIEVDPLIMSDVVRIVERK
jgi:hypothetical protein